MTALTAASVYADRGAQRCATIKRSSSSGLASCGICQATAARVESSREGFEGVVSSTCLDHVTPLLSILFLSISPTRMHSDSGGDFAWSSIAWIVPIKALSLSLSLSLISAASVWFRTSEQDERVLTHYESQSPPLVPALPLSLSLSPVLSARFPTPSQKKFVVQIINRTGSFG